MGQKIKGYSLKFDDNILFRVLNLGERIELTWAEIRDFELLGSVVD